MRKSRKKFHLQLYFLKFSIIQACEFVQKKLCRIGHWSFMLNTCILFLFFLVLKLNCRWKLGFKGMRERSFVLRTFEGQKKLLFQFFLSVFWTLFLKFCFFVDLFFEINSELCFCFFKFSLFLGSINYVHFFFYKKIIPKYKIFTLKE